MSGENVEGSKSMINMCWDDIKKLPPMERWKWEEMRKNWLEQERKQDKRELNRIKSKIYHMKNREKVKAYAREYYAKNKGRISARIDKEKRKVYYKAYYEKHKIRIAQQQRKYRVNKTGVVVGEL